MAGLIYGVNIFIGIFFTVFYSYQMFYLVVGLVDKSKEEKKIVAKKTHKFAILIAARNERNVIGELCKSIQKQNYPKDKLDVFVVADNCTDDTADIARAHGCIVIERFNKKEVGKGYALNYAFSLILDDPKNDYEAFIILDADNLLDANYVAEMNKTFDSGYRISTSYRNSKNYAQNWISSGYGLWFLREAEFLNRPRAVRGHSCAISGTGFMVATDVIKERNGWNYHLLTEDIEFSVATVLTSENIGYSAKAMLYDEQPVTFAQSWRQRLRWAKGFYQVLGKDGGNLLKSVLRLKKGWFSSYDMMMNIMPALFLTLAVILFNFIMVAYTELFVRGDTHSQLQTECLQAIGMSFLFYYMTLFLVGFVTTLTEWDNILASRWMKIRTMFTFPLFMFTYIPIAVAALFKKVEWKPIEHTVVKSIDDMK